MPSLNWLPLPADKAGRRFFAYAEADAKTDIGGGHQIRSYVLQPYQLVKALRTGTQSTDPKGVLDGDPFIESALAQRVKGGGPHCSSVSADVLYPTAGEWDQVEFHWTVADYLSAVMGSGCRLVHVEEFGDTSGAWEGAPMHGLPATLLLVGRREE